MKKLFTAEKITEVLEKTFILDHFIQWNGDNLDSIALFVETLITKKKDNIIEFPSGDGVYEVPVGGWFVKAPNGKCYACGEGVKYTSSDDIGGFKKTPQNQKEDDECEIPIWREKPITFNYPEEIYETEVVEVGNGFALQRKLDKDGKPILKKKYYIGTDISNEKDYSTLNLFAKKTKKRRE